MNTTVASAKRRLTEAVEGLPRKQVEQLADFAEYLKSREEWEATRELLSDPGMRADVEEGRTEAASGRGRGWRDVQRSL